MVNPRAARPSLGFIAFGVIGPIVGYFRDQNSCDVIRMMEATNYAILHLVIWTIAGHRMGVPAGR